MSSEECPQIWWLNPRDPRNDDDRIKSCIEKGVVIVDGQKRDDMSPGNYVWAKLPSEDGGRYFLARVPEDSGWEEGHGAFQLDVGSWHEVRKEDGIEEKKSLSALDKYEDGQQSVDTIHQLHIIHAIPDLCENIESIYNNISIVDYARKLLASKNIILHGAPGTGKTHMAKRIAGFLIDSDIGGDADASSEGSGVDDSIDHSKRQMGFVQFHPSYDYTDFVEGLRPVPPGEGPGSAKIDFKPKDGTFKEFVERAKLDLSHPYIFIIDEINRGEISKIFGELFFSIDPGYRGDEDGVLTQYANLHEDPEEKFYVPKNVYIIGTMNDIDRSVDSIDFAMRRRFRFIEVDPDPDVLGTMSEVASVDVDCAKRVMNGLNAAIKADRTLGPSYQVGPAYFLKLEDVEGDYAALWNDYIGPLLYEYVRGTYDDAAKLRIFAAAYADELEDAVDIDDLWGSQLWSESSE